MSLRNVWRFIRRTMGRNSIRTAIVVACLLTTWWIHFVYYKRLLAPVTASKGDTLRLVEAASAHCTPRQNIVFLKNHKCAGSALKNIFLRYGVTHNLNFVLPLNDNGNIIGHPKHFHRRFLSDIRRYNLTYNILAYHSRFDKEEMSKVMPADSVYVTILRRPEDQFESLYFYYELEKMFGKTIPEFLDDSALLELLTTERVIKGKIGRNQMSFDLGLRSEHFSNETAVKVFVESIAKHFQLVMIAERFDESLILLKHLLCWTTDDMVTFQINARSAKDRTSMSSKTKQKIRAWSSADTALYEYFYRVFQRRVADFGEERMAEEIRQLRSLRKVDYDQCIEERTSTPRRAPRYQDATMPFFKLKSNTTKCRYLTYTGLQYDRLLRQRQRDLIRRKTQGTGGY